MRSLRSLIPWLALGASAFSVFAGLAAAAPSPSDDLAARQVRAHTTFLADDLLEGRGTGTRGHALAARYVASQFLRLGLQPAGDAGTFDQTVPLIEATEQIEAIQEQAAKAELRLDELATNARDSEAAIDLLSEHQGQTDLRLDEAMTLAREAHDTLDQAPAK